MCPLKYRRMWQEGAARGLPARQTSVKLEVLTAGVDYAPTNEKRNFPCGTVLWVHIPSKFRLLKWAKRMVGNLRFSGSRDPHFWAHFSAGASRRQLGFASPKAHMQACPRRGGARHVAALRKKRKRIMTLCCVFLFRYPYRGHGKITTLTQNFKFSSNARRVAA